MSISKVEKIRFTAQGQHEVLIEFYRRRPSKRMVGSRSQIHRYQNLPHDSVIRDRFIEILNADFEVSAMHDDALYGWQIAFVKKGNFTPMTSEYRRQLMRGVINIKDG